MQAFGREGWETKPIPEPGQWGFEHPAVLYSRVRQPLSEVRKVYPRELLAFAPPCRKNRLFPRVFDLVMITRASRRRSPDVFAPICLFGGRRHRGRAARRCCTGGEYPRDVHSLTTGSVKYLMAA